MAYSLTKGLNYAELLQLFPAKIIKSDVDLFVVQNVVDSLLKNVPLTQDEGDFLDLLGTLIYVYEQTKNCVPDIYGIELLKALMKEYKLSSADLIPVFEKESGVLDVLNGKAQLTSAHVQKLADLFSLPSAIFEPLPNPLAL